MIKAVLVIIWLYGGQTHTEVYPMASMQECMINASAVHPENATTVMCTKSTGRLKIKR